MTVKMRLRKLRSLARAERCNDHVAAACAALCHKCGMRGDTHLLVSDAELSAAQDSGCWETHVCEPKSPGLSKMRVSFIEHPEDPCDEDYLREIST